MAKKTFEENILELESIVKELEQGNVPLNESIEKYTTAMNLVKTCNEELNSIEEKVSKIVTENGIKDFEVSDTEVNN